MTIFVTPKEGYRIPDPFIKDFLPESGREVQDDLYWHRLAADGDVTIGAAPIGPGASKTKK